jgi:hypothetical protein
MVWKRYNTNRGDRRRKSRNGKSNGRIGVFVMKEFIIEKLTELMIKQDFEDKKNKKVTYIKKVDAYRDLIKFFRKHF